MKKRGMKKRVLAALMTACMVVGSVPGVSLADVSGKLSGTLTPDAKKYNFDGSVSTETNPDIELNKTAVYNAETNDYTITLSAKAKEKVETKKTHVVFLLDASGSMNFCTNNTIREVPWQPVLKDHAHYYYETWKGKYVSGCTEIDKNPTLKSRWKIATESIKSMTDELGSDNISYDYTWFNEQNSQGDGSGSENPYSNVTPEGGTYLTEGVEHALGKFKNDDSDTDKVMVIVADGETSNTSWGSKYYPKKELKSFKSAPNNGKVYTVGFTFSSEGFKSLANGSDYNFNATDEDSLNVALNQISQKIKTGITDPLGSNVELVGDVNDITVSGSKAVAKYDSEKNEITWNDPNGLDENGVSLTYRVKVKDTLNVGNVDLNGDAVLSYTVGSENHTVQFPKPSITGATLTVNYVDENGTSVQDPVTEWVGFTGEKAFETKIPQANEEITIGTQSYRVTDVTSTDFAMPSLMVHPLMATEGKAYSVTVRLTKVETQPTIYKVTYDANGGKWDWSFSKAGYILNATGGADELTKENARGEETLEILNGNELPTRANYDFDGWYLDGKKLTSGMTVADAAGTRTEVVVEAHWKEKKPEVPSKPKDTEIVPAVIVECLNASNSGHEAKQYDLNILNSYKIGDVSFDGEKYVSTVTVFGVYYAEKYNKDVDYAHVLTTVGDITYDLTWNPVTKKWEAPALTKIPTIKVDCSKDTPIPTDPELPGFKELEDLIEGVVLVHTGSNAAAHPDKEYALMEDGYEVSWYGTTKAILTVKAAPYVSKYIADHGNHDVKGAALAKLILARTDGGWDVEEGTRPIRFFVKCTENNPEKPALPKYDDLKDLFGETINVTCETDEQHAPQSFGLMTGTYSVTIDKEDDNEAVVTVFAKDYIKAYADGKHANAGDDAATVKLFYEEEDGKWYSENQEIVINFKAKCEKTPETPEKQYTEIKFVVVNGTFTENGQTELTKTFEVGTKLTLADIPASKGKSSSYSDQTWDKFPVGYVVGKDGTTFTITYRWRSSGSDSDDSDYDYGTSTRGKATNAAGKSGRWILEGGEFTEDNGRLPSNEYLKIGDTIYGFYTYGFAIDFDRPEYYTDAAIQAKGGYRDATGTWRLNGWWFCYDDGTFPHDEWVYLTWNGRSDWYYFDVDGWMEDGWLYRNNNWYYLHTQYDNTRGRMYTGWHEIDGKWYYFNTASDKGTLGAMLANTTTPDGYQVDANGAWIR